LTETIPRRDEELEPLDELTEALYESLKGVARRTLGRQSSQINGTDLVHEAYLELARDEKYRSMHRTHFMALCATFVRRLLVREAEALRRQKFDPTLITAVDGAEDAAGTSFELLELDRILRHLAEIDERQAKIVELRFFGGMSGEEVAELLGISRRTVTKEWGMARAWLKRELQREDG
jgi:RNA polymerase sigma factor (TIGR02999 family)